MIFAIRKPITKRVSALPILFSMASTFSVMRGASDRELGSWIADVVDFLVQPIRWFTGRERSDTFVRDDLRPALWECASLFATVGQRLTRRRAAISDPSSVQAA